MSEHDNIPSPRWPAAVLLVVCVATAAILGAAIWPRVSAELQAQAQTHEDGSTWYTCGMHPWVIQPAPGDCPICHMALTPIDPERFGSELAIDPATVQRIGVRTTPVEIAPLVRAVEAVGVVEASEQALHDVNIKTAGWIETLHVDQLGQTVNKGQPLATVYSPQLYTAQQEYLLALESVQSTDPQRLPELADQAQQLLDSARTRLNFLDVSDAQIEQLEQSGQAQKTVTLRSPAAGVVVQKHAVAGMQVQPGMKLVRIADLSQVWVIATVYEQQLPFVEQDQPATLTLPHAGGEAIQGTVDYVYPTLDPQTREAKVRLVFDNPGGRLKPGMFANVTLQKSLGEALQLPRQAVMDTGDRQVVFVALGDGRFEPREVTLGPAGGGGHVAVTEGLSEGELVVTSGQFLLDSESSVREALAKMIGGGEATEPAREQRPALPEPTAEVWSRAIRAYFETSEAVLAGQVTEELTASAMAVAEAIEALRDQPAPAERPHLLHELEQPIALAIDAAAQVARAEAIDPARRRLADLSQSMGALARALGVPEPVGPVVEMHCPMYGGDAGASWLQPDGPVRNPYMGEAMLRCHDAAEPMPAAPVANAEEATP